jgi:hypothetical protein
MLNTTLYDKAGWWFLRIIPSNKTDHDDITEILLKVALYIIILTPNELQNFSEKKLACQKECTCIYITAYLRDHVFMPCMDFTELSPLQKVQGLIGDTCYYFNQECVDFFDYLGKSMFKRVYMYVRRSSVLNID